MSEPSLMQPGRWAARRRRAAPVAMVSGAAFADLGAQPSLAGPPDEPPPMTHQGPVAAYLSGGDDSWCATRRGVWWPTVGVWVDRLELTSEDVPPAGARTYPLVPPPGLSIGTVHGQVDDQQVSHVLVTSRGGEVITQASVTDANDQDKMMLVVAALVAAAGGAAQPTEPFEACATGTVLTLLGAQDWGSGWSLELDELPGLVTRILNEIG